MYPMTVPIGVVIIRELSHLELYVLDPYKSAQTGKYIWKAI
jgi:hypothetical protein